MINVQESVPQVYYEQSRDFQVLGRLFELVLNAVKTSADSLYYLPVADAEAQTRFLDLLSYTLGFQARHTYNNKQLAAVCSVFPTLLRKKGTIEAIQLLGDTLLSSEGITENFGCSVNGTKVELFIPNALSSTNLLNDLLDYLLPAGMTCEITRADTSAINAISEIKTNAVGVHFYLDGDNNNFDYHYPLPKTSVIPSIRNDTALNYLGKTSRYATGSQAENKYTWKNVKPVNGALANTAVLDTTSVFDLQTGKFQGNFYDIIWELPLKEIGGKSYTLDLDGLKTFVDAVGISRVSTIDAKPIAISIDASNNIEDSKESYNYSVVRDEEHNIISIEDKINGKDYQCERFKAGKALSGAALTFPSVDIIKNLYVDGKGPADIRGFEVTILVDTKFVLAGGKTFGLLELLSRIYKQLSDKSFDVSGKKLQNFDSKLFEAAENSTSHTTQFELVNGTLVTDNLITKIIRPEITGNKIVSTDKSLNADGDKAAIIEYYGTHLEGSLSFPDVKPIYDILATTSDDDKNRVFVVKDIKGMRDTGNWGATIFKIDDDSKSSWEPEATSASNKPYVIYKHYIDKVAAQTYKLPVLYQAQPAHGETDLYEIVASAGGNVEIPSTCTVIDLIRNAGQPVPIANAKIIIKPLI